MLQTIRKILSLLSNKERRNLIFLSIFMVLNALLEVFGIASIAPLIVVITNPSSLETIPFLNDIYTAFDFTDFRQFSIVLAGCVLCIIILSNSMMLLTNYLSIRYANHREHSIGCLLLKTYLYQPYAFFLERHSAELLRNIFNEVAYIASNIIIQSLNLLSKSISAIAIIIFVFIVHPQVTLIMSFILGGAYTITYLFVKKPLYSLGKRNVALTEDKLKSITDSVRVIRDIKMLGAEKAFLGVFDKAAYGYAKVRTLSDIISITPRYIIEVFAISALVIAILYLVSTKSNANEILPILGIYAFAGYRLMPALQQIFIALSKIQFSSHSLDIVSGELATLEKTSIENMNRDVPSVPFTKSFALKDAGFAYKDKDIVLEGINLTVHKGEKIGIIGASGAGKSTLIDLLVGLSVPQNGGLYIDGTPLNPEHYPGWRKNISYVSQNVYLLDDSIDMNISVEHDISATDQKRIARACDLALVNDFLDDMNEDTNLVVGENGIRLSGGQRQRIGIARALYQDREILVLDEATSALDHQTEKKLLDNIEKEHSKTMILITHRVETLRFCERIYVIANGKIVDKGPYEGLLKNSKPFQQLLKTFEN